MQELQALLSELQTALAKSRPATAPDNFNIFRLLRQETDEVNLHSRFLAELLDPNGSHDCGNIFLQLFLTQCEISQSDFHVDTARMLRESSRIDILLHTNQEAIIIENKIWAGDQDKQLERYADVIEGRKLRYRILYLTPHGHPPSKQSVGRLASLLNYKQLVTCISYVDHIQRWMQACIKEAAMRPPLRETLVQYLSLINNLTGNSMSEAEKLSVVELMNSGDNAVNAYVLVENWKHVRWHTERDFWQELAEAAEADGHIITPDWRYTEAKITQAVHSSHSRAPWYGIAFLLPTSMLPTSISIGGPLQLVVERGYGRLHYGLFIPGDDTPAKKQFYDAVKKVTQHLHHGHSEEWPVLVYPQRHINFGAFDHADTHRLANPTMRQETVKELWQEIRVLMQQVEASFSGVELPSYVQTN